MKTMARVAGKISGAFTLDGKDNYIEIPNSEKLENVQEGSYTLMAWYKPADIPAGTESDNNAQYGIILKTGWHLGLTFNSDKKFLHTHWLKGDTDPVWTGVGTWDTEYEAGKWYHVVGMVDIKERVAKIYVDGELKGTSQEWDESAKPRDYEQTTWKIGTGSPGAEKWAWHARGDIDDVRIYASALSESEIKAIFDAGSSGKEK